MPNRLANETSPYLLQHQDNPVDWYPWGAEALAKAKAENKPILVSIGYSSCHWCHVMAHESFEDEAIAAQLNRDFVAIKVDREERPDIDSIYMNALQIMGGNGGWPLNVFVTPIGTPFYGGTYWPPSDRHGMPGFPSVLSAVSEAWQTNREGLIESANKLLAHLGNASGRLADDSIIPPDLGEQALAQLRGQFDPLNGGFGRAPKFPQAPVLDFLLRHAEVTGNGLDMLTITLDHMADGGIHDQLGDGFARYTVDQNWLIPHFEKMLYDNAQLASIYTATGKLTGNPVVGRGADFALRWVGEEMRSPEGGFYSALDADSEGVEGKFYVWTAAEIDELLNPEEADLARLHWGITEDGNFEGNNILSIVRPLADIAAQSGQPITELGQTLASARQKLLSVRAKRVRPGLDDKVIVSWNGLMIGALADAAPTTDLPVLEWASAAVAHILDHGLRPDGSLCRTLKGTETRGNGVLEDYAFLADGLVRLYVVTGNQAWLDHAGKLFDYILAHFSHEDGIGFYDTSDAHEQLIVRPRDLHDGAVPCGTSVVADLLITFAAYLQDESLWERAEKIVAGVADAAARYPTAFGRFLAVAERLKAGTRELALVGDTNEIKTLARVATGRFDPSLVIGYVSPDGASVPMLQDRPLPAGTNAAAYLCRDYICLPPVSTPEELVSLLESNRGPER